MDIGATIGISVASTSTGLATIWLINKIMKIRLKSRLSALLILKGVSSICNRMTTAKVLFLDVDQLLQEHPAYESSKNSPAHMILLYPSIKAKVYEILKQYKYKVVLVSRNYELLKLLYVLKKNIIFFAQSKQMAINTKLLYDDEEEAKADELLKLRLSMEIPHSQIVICESLADQDNKIRQMFGIQELNL